MSHTKPSSRAHGQQNRPCAIVVWSYECQDPEHLVLVGSAASLDQLQYDLRAEGSLPADFPRWSRTLPPFEISYRVDLPGEADAQATPWPVASVVAHLVSAATWNSLLAERDRAALRRGAAPFGSIVATLGTRAHLENLAIGTPGFALLRALLAAPLFATQEGPRGLLPFAFAGAAVQTHATAEVRALLSVLLSQTADVEVTVQVPVEEQARACYTENRTLLAQLTVHWNRSGNALHLSLPVPWHGVFLLYSPAERTAAAWTWVPRLVPSAGTRRLRTYLQYRGRPASVDWLEYAVPTGQALRVPLAARVGDGEPLLVKKLLAKCARDWVRQGAKKLRSFVPLPGAEVPLHAHADAATFTAWSRRTMCLAGPRDPARAELVKQLDKLASAPWALALPVFDADDLNVQRLYSYGAYVVDRLVQMLLRRLVGTNVEAFRDPRQGRKARRSRLLASWDALCQDPAVGLDPWIPLLGLQRNGWMDRFEPRNAIDAVSQLTRLQRFDMRGATLEQLPPSWRQNHPSHKHLICCVESPESKKVGLTLHLARGATVDAAGALQAGSPPSVLGYAASLVPHCEHNDGARVMMGAKNLKQALPIRGSGAPRIATGHEDELESLLAPLRAMGICPSTPAFYSPGVDLLVAYVPWYGWNIDDAIVANRKLADEGVLDFEATDDGKVYIRPRLRLCAPLRDVEAFSAETRLRRPGPIRRGQPLAHFAHDETGQVFTFLWQQNRPCDLLDLKFAAPEDPDAGGVLSWKLARRRAFGIGDKLMGRHGNKGVVSALVDDKDLPRLPDHPGLPPHLRKRAVDLVLNPNGVISRMNIGQLLETQLGLLAHALVGSGIPADWGRQFAAHDWSTLKESFRSIGATDDGRMHLVMPDGSPMLAPVVAGFQHFVRLAHIPSDKAQVRGRGDRRSGYSMATGQPLGGRKSGGGLRLGEMEVWGIAAHEAHALLDDALSLRGVAPEVAPQVGAGKTFQAIRQHLFALRISLREAPNGYSVHWACPQEVIDSTSAVKNAEVWKPALRATFRCGKPFCKYELPVGVIDGTGTTERDDSLRVTVEDLLRHRGVSIERLSSKVLPLGGGNLDAPLIRASHKDRPSKSLTASWTMGQKSVGVSFRLGAETFVAYSQYSSQSRTFQLADALTLPLCCPKHKTTALRPVEAMPTASPVPGGLADPHVFGDPNERFAQVKRGRIDLPFEVSLPSAWFRGVACPPPPGVTSLPVLPLAYRYPFPQALSAHQVSHNDSLTRKYARLLSLVAAWDESAPADIKTKLRSRIVKAVADIDTVVRDRLLGKHGLLRGQALGRRVDWSSRLVIVPGPDLAWDQVGMPVAVLLVLLYERLAVANDLGLDNDAQRRWARLLERTRIAARMPNLAGETPRRAGQALDELVLGRDEHDVGARALRAWLASHAKFVVVLNRQPTLQRLAIQAFRPVPNDESASHVLRLPPLACRGFGADFDGDEIVIHAPGDGAAAEQAQRMLPTDPRNLTFDADDSPAPSFDQDFALGHFFMARDGMPPYLEALAPLDRCGRCQRLFADGEKFLAHVCKEHPEQAGSFLPAWARAAYERATLEAVSFGFQELRTGVPENKRRLLSEACLSTNPNKALDTSTLEVLEPLANAADRSMPARGFAVLPVSKARGRKQVRQLVTARGSLSPGVARFEIDVARFFFASSLLDGMTEEEFFWAAMNSRSSMLDKKLATPTAGKLTRRLVLACWPFAVTSKACRSPASRSPAYCRSRTGVCAACYGAGPDRSRSAVGRPVGLLAALSVGERGTQLSMQAFHAGQRAVSVDDVLRIFQGGDPEAPDEGWFGDPKNCAGFVARFKQIPAYEQIAERHLRVIWRVLHNNAEHTLTACARADDDLFRALVAPYQWKGLLRFLEKARATGRGSPWGRVMLAGSDKTSNGPAGEGAR